MPDLLSDAPHPDVWVFGRLLESVGLGGDPATALGLAGGAGFLGMGFRYDDEDVSILHVSGWNPFQSDLPGAAKRLGVVGMLDETSRPKRAAKRLASALAAETPVALWIDAATVGLAPEAMRGASPGVVLARPEGDGRIALDDGLRAVRVEPAVLAEARAVHGVQRHRLLALRAPKTADPPAALRGGLARAAVGATGGEASDRGPDGVRQLADSIGGDGEGSWRSVFEGDRHLLGALTNLHGAITREQGLLRGPQAAFERRAAEVLDLGALVEVADAHDALAAGWLRVAEQALPADVPGLAAARRFQHATDLPPELTETPLPLTAAERGDLLVDLGAAVSALATAEADALELLRNTLRTH